MIYVGIGGNVGGDDEIVGRFRSARERLDARRSSSLYRSAPLGMTAQAPFLNAVLELDSGGRAPRDLLAELQAIEDELGRVRVGAGWGPRTIDLDLLMVDRLKAQEPGLTLPHPRIQQRAFVLRPLAELVGDDFVIPGTGQTVAQCLAHVADQTIDLVLADW
ncbi:MAG TPA: 2-amino-4-hydroxy-6-hydroxymethyldihydropteridine diphosphokinase [Kofleriaceae bacterium]|nr:2-amino-4-hydroxy-6-hydroxymethyldihydropteridine diphosphokinase [Kofleriaceae bacterium]